MLAQQGAQRRRGMAAARLHLQEHGRFLDGAADEDADHDERDGQQKGHAPAPGHEVVGADQGGDAPQHAGGDDHAQRHADLREGAEQRTSLPGRVLDRHERRAAPFATGGKALQHAQGHQHHRRPDADLRVGRQHADQGGGHAHQDQRGRQHPLAAVAVAQVAADDGAQRPEQEGHAHGRERQDQRQLGVFLGEGREEQGTQHQPGGLDVDEVVVPFDGRADQRGGQHLAVVGADQRAGRGPAGGCDGGAVGGDFCLHGCLLGGMRRFSFLLGGVA
ncbi:hypothetical protein D9M68_464550 [compost metagenome]